MGQMLTHPSEMSRNTDHSSRQSPIGMMARKGPSSERARVFPGVKASYFEVLPHESEDVQITGGTRSLVRRLLALNLEGSLRKKAQVVPALTASRIA